MSEYFVFELDCSNSERSVKMALSSSRIALREKASKYRGSSELECVN